MNLRWVLPGDVGQRKREPSWQFLCMLENNSLRPPRSAKMYSVAGETSQICSGSQSWRGQDESERIFRVI